MTRYCIELRTRIFVNGYGFLSLARNSFNKYRKKILNTVTKPGLYALKTTSKIVVHKAAELRGELIGNKIDDKVLKLKPDADANSKN